MHTSLHVSPQLAFSSILIGFETTANEFNKQTLVSHLERQDVAKHDPDFQEGHYWYWLACSAVLQ